MYEFFTAFTTRGDADQLAHRYLLAYGEDKELQLLMQWGMTLEDARQFKKGMDVYLQYWHAQYLTVIH